MCTRGVLWSYETENAVEALAQRQDLMNVIQQHAGWDVDEAAAHVIYTELVGNVIRHAPGRVAVTLECDGKSVLLRVADDGPAFSFHPSLPKNTLQEGGRGLFIVATFAQALKVEKIPNEGAVVAVKLPTKPCFAGTIPDA